MFVTVVTCHYSVIVDFHTTTMTELNIGVHCSQEDCKQLDFLPIHCQLCDRIFCKTHSSLTAHNCPISNPAYRYHPISQSHFSATVITTTTEDDAGSVCDFHECNQRQLVLLACEACSRNYCISHKQKEVHRCSFLKSNQTDKIQIIKTIDYSSLNAISHTLTQSKPKECSTKPLNDRTRATKSKLILLRAKMEALPGGKHARNLPESERFVLRLSIMPDIVPNNSIISAYFGKRWPLGCVLDYGCEQFHLPRDKNYGLIRLSDELDADYQVGRYENDTVANSLLDLSCTIKQHVHENCFIEGELLQVVYIPQMSS
ncbi:unnamed protein product [Heterobilharzia americana]|nr:unnamed protein product [Heterobilharzia americana]